MWMPSSTPFAQTPDRRRLWRAAPAVAVAAVLGASGPALAQAVVFDPRNHVENALQSARQLESLANEARQLAHEARMLAASPYSHLAETSQTLRDIGALAETVRGVASSVEDLERQFDDLYSGDLADLDLADLNGRAAGRRRTARATAEDLARTAAELDRLARARGARVSGALQASEAAEGQTAAIQSSTQMLAVLAEDLAAMRTTLLAQSRLMAEAAAREAAERDAAAETRRRFWRGREATPAAPRFDPFTRARD